MIRLAVILIFFYFPIGFLCFFTLKYVSRKYIFQNFPCSLVFTDLQIYAFERKIHFHTLEAFWFLCFKFFQFKKFQVIYFSWNWIWYHLEWIPYLDHINHGHGDMVKKVQPEGLLALGLRGPNHLVTEVTQSLSLILQKLRGGFFIRLFLIKWS